MSAGLRVGRMTETQSVRSTLPLVPYAIIAALLLWAAPASAQTELSGTWRLASSDAETAQRTQSIEAATASMNVFRRGPARGRLTERTAPQPGFQITVEGDRVVLGGGGGRAVTLVVGGPAVTLQGENGSGTLRATRRQGRLVITMRGGNGVRTTVYRLSPNGQRVVLETQLVSDQLSAPIRYRVTYRRA